MKDCWKLYNLCISQWATKHHLNSVVAEVKVPMWYIVASLMYLQGYGTPEHQWREQDSRLSSQYKVLHFDSLSSIPPWEKSVAFISLTCGL